MLMHRLGSVPRLVSRLGSGVRVSASFQICLVASCYTPTSALTSAFYTLEHPHFRIIHPATLGAKLASVRVRVRTRTISLTI